MIGEVGEIAELMITLHPLSVKAWKAAEKDELAQELADITIYCIRFTDVCGLNIVKELDALIDTRRSAALVEATESEEEMSFGFSINRYFWFRRRGQSEGFDNSHLLYYVAGPFAIFSVIVLIGHRMYR